LQKGEESLSLEIRQEEKEKEIWKNPLKQIRGATKTKSEEPNGP